MLHKFIGFLVILRSDHDNSVVFLSKAKFIDGDAYFKSSAHPSGGKVFPTSGDAKKYIRKFGIDNCAVAKVIENQSGQLEVSFESNTMDVVSLVPVVKSTSVKIRH